MVRIWILLSTIEFRKMHPNSEKDGRTLNFKRKQDLSLVKQSKMLVGYYDTIVESDDSSDDGNNNDLPVPDNDILDM